MKAALLVLSVLLLLPLAFANGDNETHCMWGGMLGGGMWTGLWVIVIFGGLFLFTIFFFAMQSQQTRTPPHRKDGLRIAEGRLAKGEITGEEFDEIKRRIQS
jgi:putative membrane protein